MQWYQGYILHHRPWRETSLWLEVFSRECGKVALLAKGARRSRKRPPLQPLQPLLLRWRKKGDLGTLVDVDPLAPQLSLEGKSLFCSFYLNELLSCLLMREDPHPELFDAYRDALACLARGGDLEVGLRHFELSLLRGIGYAPVLDHEVEYGTDIVANLTYRYEPERGPVLDSDGWLAGRTLIALRQGTLETREERREAKRLLRLLIDQHLQGRPLKSRALFLPHCGNK